MTTDKFGEVNRKFWNEQANSILDQDWVLQLCQQVRDCLQSSVDWIEIRKSSPGGPPTKMIDYACGNGIVSQALFEYADIIRGIDVSDAMVKAYNDLARQSDIPPARMHAVRGNFLDTGDDDTTAGADFHEVDAIIMSMALHHAGDEQGMISNMARRLRSKGVLVVIDWMTSASDRGHESSQTSDKPDASHSISKSSFSVDDMRQLFTEAGCEPSSIDFRPYKEASHIPESVAKVKGGVDRTFFIAKARKP
ncbi:S-adenosyl-L-methionine-dependent methyltransferase [Hypoxylon sp. FL1150]|nr:S-adenosyl-L-methionine-dependent methyltransferase [Hypoxylon sp. FL1150]